MTLRRESREADGPAGAEDDVAGQVGVLRAQAVRDPSSDRCAARKHVAGQRVINRGTMIVVIHFNAVDERQVVHTFADVGKQCRDVTAAPTILLEVKRTWDRAMRGFEKTFNFTGKAGKLGKTAAGIFL